MYISCRLEIAIALDVPIHKSTGDMQSEQVHLRVFKDYRVYKRLDYECIYQE